MAFAVKSGTVIGGSDTYVVTNYYLHPEWDNTAYSPDVALLGLAGADFASVPQFLPREMADELRVGQPVATMGFPGEVGDRDTTVPIATFKDGTISALRPYNATTTNVTPENTKLVYHNLDTSPGTSGSPIFDHQGLIVAANNAGTSKLALNPATGEFERIPSGNIGWGIRVDEAWSLIDLLSDGKPIAFREPTPHDWHESTGSGPLGRYVPFPPNWNGITVPPPPEQHIQFR